MTRPLLARRDTRTEEAAFVRAVRMRDGFTCRMMIWRGTVALDQGAWVECGEYASDTAHIIKRNDCGKVKFNPIVGIRACRRCHDIYDGRRPGEVYTPFDRLEAARALVFASNKTHSHVIMKGLRSNAS
jgi:hypothetical protein